MSAYLGWVGREDRGEWGRLLEERIRLKDYSYPDGGDNSSDKTQQIKPKTTSEIYDLEIYKRTFFPKGPKDSSFPDIYAQHRAYSKI